MLSGGCYRGPVGPLFCPCLDIKWVRIWDPINGVQNHHPNPTPF